MSNKTKIVLLAVVALIIGIVIGAMFAPSNSNLGSIRFTQDKFTAGLTAGQYDEFSISSAGVVTTSGTLASGALTATGNSSVVGTLTVDEFTEGGGIITVSTTSAAYTLTAAELAGGNVISIADTESPALALTLPATSTLTSVIPTAGDSRDWWIQNLHTTAATTTTITIGTGIELQGDGTGDDVINGGVWGKLSCFRQASTDVVCHVVEFVAAD